MSKTNSFAACVVSEAQKIRREGGELEGTGRVIEPIGTTSPRS